MKKIICLIAATLMISAALAGCSQQAPAETSAETLPPSITPSAALEETPAENVPPQDTAIPQTQKPEESQSPLMAYYQKVVPYFYQGYNHQPERYALLYNGAVEFGYILYYEGMEEKGDTLNIKYRGEMNDGYGEDERGSRQFYVTYQITDGQIVEIIDNQDYLRNRSDVLSSVIPNFVALKGAIEEGASWEQTVSVNGVDYTAITTITEASDDGFRTDTVIDGIEGYPDNTYSEVRVYKAGLGLAVYGCSIPGDEAFSFGYTFTALYDSESGQLIENWQ